MDIRAIVDGVGLAIDVVGIAVIVALTFSSVGVLAMIVAIRTFLSFSLEVELTGRWPWQPARVAVTPATVGANAADGAG